MLFGRRDKAGLGERLRVALWPRVGWRRSGSYYLKRMVRLPGTPASIATGAALGAFISCTPLLGFHFAITFALAWLLRVSVVAGALGSMVGNPLTLPFIWAGSYELGQLMLDRVGRDAPANLEHLLAHGSWRQIRPLAEPMILGSIPIGLAVGCFVYPIVYKAVAAYRTARRQRLADEHRSGVGHEAARFDVRRA